MFIIHIIFFKLRLLCEIFLDQSHYVKMILKKYKYFNYKSTFIRVKLLKNKGVDIRNYVFASIIGNLLYCH